MKNIKEKLKIAISSNDIDFLDKNKTLYDINDRFEDEDNDSLLLYSLSDPNCYIYTFFIENGADTSAVNNEGEGILHAIVYSGDSERLKYIIKNNNVDLNKKMNDGTTPLLLSVLLNNYDIFNALLELGADVNLKDNDGNAPLHPACSLGYIDMVKDLVKKGAYLKIKTKKGNYPFALAINGDHDEIVKYLYKIIYEF